MQSEDFISMSRDIKALYNDWVKNVTDTELKEELISIEQNEEAINDAFYQDLSFGTAGLRGVQGAGTNRMNIHTVAKASQGLANYINKTSQNEVKKIALGYDSRINSDVYAQVATGIFAANGIHVYVYDTIIPTPMVSFAVRELECDSGVVITASHNPAIYNGYKVYREDGCQISTEQSEDISREISELDIFADIVDFDYEASFASGDIESVPEYVSRKYLDEVKKQSLITDDLGIDKDVKIIYSPLNGTGLVPLTTVLAEEGYTNVTLVEEQKDPDGNFPTAPYPNPEMPEAMALGIEYAIREDADMFLATDPDADRVGMAIKKGEGDFQIISGNQIGILVLDYICSRRRDLGRLSDSSVFVTTIVSTTLAEKIAEHYGVETRKVLTGFKHIGEEIAKLEVEDREDDFIFGFEEANGYLVGTHVRDKDAVVTALIVVEMFAYYRSLGISLDEKLESIYTDFGYTYDKQNSFTYEGEDGFEKMSNIMKDLREYANNPTDELITSTVDYLNDDTGIPKSNVLKFNIDNGGQIVARPSGTEPKLKIYLSINADKDEIATVEESIMNTLKDVGGIE